jgi:prolycopene isomerase
MDYPGVTDWQAHKREIEDYVVGCFEKAVPGISDKIVVRLSASAATSHRFTLNFCGAMLGWEMSPWQLGKGRPSIEGPVKNLYMVGHWTRPGGGITPAIISALHAAKAVSGAAVEEAGLPPPVALAAMR